MSGSLMGPRLIPFGKPVAPNGAATVVVTLPINHSWGYVRSLLAGHVSSVCRLITSRDGRGGGRNVSQKGIHTVSVKIREDSNVQCNLLFVLCSPVYVDLVH